MCPCCRLRETLGAWAAAPVLLAWSFADHRCQNHVRLYSESRFLGPDLLHRVRTPEGPAREQTGVTGCLGDAYTPQRLRTVAAPRCPQTRRAGPLSPGPERHHPSERPTAPTGDSRHCYVWEAPLRAPWRARCNPDPWARPQPQLSDAGCLQSGLGVGVSHKLPGDADAAGARATLREPLSRTRRLTAGRS